MSLRSAEREAPVRVLALEDDPLDVGLIAAELRRNGLECRIEHVDRRAAFESALRAGGFDVILADHALPGFDAMTALGLARALRPDVPFIIVSGTLGEEPAIEALTRGATDYVLKHRLRRLAPAVRRALRESRLRAERARAERALRESERRYRLLYDENPSMLFTLDADGRILSVNRFGAAQLGYRVEELTGMSMAALHLPEERSAVEEFLARCLAGGDEPRRWDVRKRRKDGAAVWVRETVRRIDGASARPRLLSVCEDASEAHALSEKLSHQASHDGLTGLVNRREFERRLERVIRTSRDAGAEHALCYLDLDQFKVVNDTCGHLAGDELLRQLALVMKHRVRTRDTLARLGGDEFAVLIEHCAVDAARRVAGGLASAIADFRFVWEGKIFTVGASIGLVPIRPDSSDANAVLAAADAACYAAKETGGRRIHVFRPDDERLARRHGEMQWVSRIHEALEAGRLRLERQAIVPVARPARGGDGVERFELLLRLVTAEGTPVLPREFLPAAERYGLAADLDRWVVDAALGWLEREVGPRGEGTLCFVNLSAQSLGDERLLAHLERRLDGGRLDPRSLCLEVTESSAIANLEGALRLMSTLRGRGVRFALDDFGSGVSSFAYLKHLPIDFLKIDGQFVRDMAASSVDRALVKAMAEVGRVMGKRTVAEFVDDPRLLPVLAELGVDFAQGFAVEVPRPMLGAGGGEPPPRSR